MRWCVLFEGMMVRPQSSCKTCTSYCSALCSSHLPSQSLNLSLGDTSLTASALCAPRTSPDYILLKFPDLTETNQCPTYEPTIHQIRNTHSTGIVFSAGCDNFKLFAARANNNFFTLVHNDYTSEISNARFNIHTEKMASF